jgi:hypothetical protein
MNKALKIFGLALFVSVMGAKPLHAKTGGDFGIGISLFGPTGITVKKYTTGENAWDAALGWDIDDHLYVHSDYLWHKKNAFQEKTAAMHVHYGIGGRFILIDRDDNNDKKGNDDDDEDAIIGVRVPLGLDFTFANFPIEFFAELALTLDIVPDTDADLGIAIGGRYFF